MRNDYYPPGTVRSLLNTDAVTSQTSDILKQRLDRKEIIQPSFFNADAFSTLRAVCDRLIPQYTRAKKIDLAGCLDEMLAEGNGNGWRYDKMPPDGDAYKKGMSGIDETAALMFGATFQQLELPKQDEILSSIQNKTAIGKTWEIIPANLFFEELLAQLTEFYYSHPEAKEEIGEAAMADAKGWKKIGLNERELWEPETLNKEGDSK